MSWKTPFTKVLDGSKALFSSGLKTAPSMPDLSSLRPDDTTGEAICAFVVLKRARPSGDEVKKVAAELRQW